MSDMHVVSATTCLWRVTHVCLGLQPVLVHMSKNSEGKFSFNPVSINFLVEVVKTTFAIAMLVIYVSFYMH